jgi:very-short-patch-repair endonuclease
MDNPGSVRAHNESGDAAIAAIADAQHGVFGRQQAMELGLSARQIQSRITEQLWEVVFRGVYRVIGARQTLQQSAMAAALYAGDGALISHGTAGLLWEIEGVRSKGVELWVPDARRSTLDGLVVHRGTRLDRADRTAIGSIPITTPVRTLIDLSARLEDARLLAAAEAAFRRGLCTPERLLVRADVLRNSGRPGAGRLADLLADRGAAPALESTLEAELWLLVQRSGLPIPRRQFWVSLPGGRYRLDFAWPEQKVGLECDGRAYHDTRAAFDPDRARLAEFGAAHWRVLPVTWNACTREPERVERWLRSALREAA